MKHLTAALVLPYVLFALFHFYMSWLVKNYRGASASFGVVLSVIAFAGMIFQYGFVLLFAWRIGVLPAALLLALGFLGFLLVVPLELLARRFVHRDMPAFLGLLAIPVLPVAAWLMVRQWPHTPLP